MDGVPFAWIIYWRDAMGVLLVAPLFLTFSSLYAIPRVRITELATLIVLLALTCLVIFNDRC
jgi:Gpi18-like mannosyltransferase